MAYTSGAKTVQTLTGVWTIVHQPRYGPNSDWARLDVLCQAAQWQQIAPRHCTSGYDVIAQIGWWRQTHSQRSEAIHEALQPQLQISESEVRHLYHERYLPLLACHERQHLQRLSAVSEQSGLILSLDGLCPEGGDPPLWVVRELHSGQLETLRFVLPLFWFTVLVFIVGICMGVGKAAVYKHIPEYFPNDVGAVGGLVGMLGALGGFFLPPVFAAVTEWTWIPQSTFFADDALTANSHRQANQRGES